MNEKRLRLYIKMKKDSAIINRVDYRTNCFALFENLRENHNNTLNPLPPLLYPDVFTKMWRNVYQNKLVMPQYLMREYSNALEDTANTHRYKLQSMYSPTTPELPLISWLKEYLYSITIR